MHRIRIGTFYTLAALATAFLCFEVVAHLTVDTPVVTKWAPPHHIHALGHAIVTALLVIAIGSQLHPRFRRIAGLQIFLLASLSGLAVSLIALRGFSNLDFPVVNFTAYSIAGLLILAVHPQRGSILECGRLNLRLLLLAVAGLVPLTGYAALEVGKQWAGTDPVHASPDHWALMGATAVVLGLVGCLSAVGGQGRALAAWTSGLGVAGLGLAGVVLPHEASSFGLVGGSLALIWGAALVSVERARWALTERQVANAASSARVANPSLSKR